MSRLRMMAGSVAPGTEAGTERVSAYVVLADGPKSRLFKLAGTTASPQIEELDAATTLDLRRFQEQSRSDLEGRSPVRPADATWACEQIRLHLRYDLGL